MCVFGGGGCRHIVLSPSHIPDFHLKYIFMNPIVIIDGACGDLLLEYWVDLSRLHVFTTWDLDGGTTHLGK